jgi:tetratricopeptide (TPR) repeat protein
MGLDAIVDSKLMTTEEVARLGGALAEANSVNGEIWRQVGFEQLALEQLEDAASSFQKSIESATEEMVQARTNRTVEYAWVLTKLGRNDQAAALLANLDGGLLLGANPGRYQSLQSELNKSPQ